MFKISSEMKKAFKGHNYSGELIMICLFMKCRYSLSYREVEEIGRLRRLDADHTTILRWIHKFMHLLEVIFKKRKKPVCTSWRADETYIRMNGTWVYLYRAVDKYGDTIDFFLSEKRDLEAAKIFFKKAIRSCGRPTKVNIDKSGANTSALNKINEELPEEERIEIRQNKYLNNLVEQDHRFIKKKTKPTLGFKNFWSALATITGIEVIHMIHKGQLFNCEKYGSVFSQFASLAA